MHPTLRAGAVRAALPLVATILGLHGCRDATTNSNSFPDEPVMRLRTLDAPQPMSVRETKAIDARGPNAVAFHARNRMSWVGETHNRGIEAYLKDKKGRKLTSPNVCQDVLNYFDKKVGIYPNHIPEPSAEQRRAANRLGVRIAPCGKGLAGVLPASLEYGWPQEPQVSVEAVSLLADVGIALDHAATPEALAGELLFLLQRIEALPEAEADAVAAAASVAQSSYEYWDAKLCQRSNRTGATTSGRE